MCARHNNRRRETSCGRPAGKIDLEHAAGAAGAIGEGIARRFAAEGAHVVCADIDLAKAQSLAGELNRTNSANRSVAVDMDVTREESVRIAYQDVLLEYGGVDVVVSNAGIAHSCPLDELSLEDWERSFAVNATGHFVVAREALRIMKTQGTGGSIVFQMYAGPLCLFRASFKRAAAVCFVCFIRCRDACGLSRQRLTIRNAPPSRTAWPAQHERKDPRACTTSTFHRRRSSARRWPARSVPHASRPQL